MDNGQEFNGEILFQQTPDQVKLQQQRMEMMRKRLEQRQKLMERSRKRRSANPGQNEVDKFLEKFNKTEADVKQQLKKITKETLTPDFFDSVKTTHATLIKDIGAGGRALPGYLLEVCRKKIDELRKEINAKEKEIAPKSKFRFAQKKKLGKKKKVQTKSYEKLDLDKFISGDEITIKDKNLETIYKEPGSINGSDVVLSNLQNCSISICDNIGALRMNNLSHCKLYIGPVASSMLVDKISYSTVVVAIRQCRIHTATNTDFYLHVNSDPIIEHSHSLRFAPYCFQYPEFDGQFLKSGLDKLTNTWYQVKDFNWHRQQHSPNWTLIPEGEKVKDIKPQKDEDVF